MNLKGKPWVCEATKAHADGLVVYGNDGSATVTIEGSAHQVPASHQYDLTQATIFGLNERLTLSARGASGRGLREEFNDEWEKYGNLLGEATPEHPFQYGYYAYYPEQNDLVRFCPPYWHHTVAVTSSSTLLTDKDKKLSWAEVREKLSTTVVAVAGCSVGSSVIHSLVMDMRPNSIKVADKSLYKMENINRVRLGYFEMVKSRAERASEVDLALKNKARVVADQLYAMDPYMNVFVYDEGVTLDNVKEFFDGSDREPPADIIVEEVDDPRVKLFIREEARKRKLPVVMVTDIGSAVQLDVCRFDKDTNAPLTYGASDKELYGKMEDVYARPGNRQAFFAFVDALIGTAYRQDELADIILEKSEIPTSTLIPQLGSTVAMAGAVAAEAVARIRLGYDYPPRAIINKHTLTSRIIE
jgi:molybdopterin/thiamine biosynthesis adenylyltransferase